MTLKVHNFSRAVYLLLYSWNKLGSVDGLIILLHMRWHSEVTLTSRVCAFAVSYYTDMYKCLYATLKTSCNATASVIYTSYHATVTHRRLATKNCSISEWLLPSLFIKPCLISGLRCLNLITQKQLLLFTCLYFSSLVRDFMCGLTTE